MFQVLHSQKNLIERSDQVPFTCTFSSSIFFPLHEPPLHAVFTLQEWRDNSLMERNSYCIYSANSQNFQQYPSFNFIWILYLQEVYA